MSDSTQRKHVLVISASTGVGHPIGIPNEGFDIVDVVVIKHLS